MSAVADDVALVRRGGKGGSVGDYREVVWLRGWGAVGYDLKYGWQRLVVVCRGCFILNLGWNRFGTPERFDQAWARLRCELVNLGFL